MNRRLYIAEDDKNLLKIYGSIFSAEEFDEESKIEASLFDNGEDLLDSFIQSNAEGNPVPLCILDVRLPGMDGFEIAQKIREIDERVNIIFVTGFSDKSQKELRESLKYDYYYMRKPFMEEEILSLVDSLLKRWDQTQLLEQKNREIMKQANDLAQSRQRFNHLTENLQKEYFFYTHDKEGIYLFITPSIEGILGYSGVEFQEKRHEIMTGNPRNKLANMFTKLSLQGKQQPSYEVELVHKNGSIVTLEIAEFPIENDDGEVIAIEGMAHDITRAKKERELNKQQNQFLGKVIDSLSHPFYVINPDNYNLILSNSAARSINSTSITTCHKLRYDNDKPCSECEMPCPIEELKRTKKPVKLEHKVIDPIDGEKYYSIHAYPILDNKNNLIQVIEYSLDITDRKQAEEEIQKTTERYTNMFKLSPEAIVLTDKNGIIIDINERIEEWLGYKCENLLGKYVLDLPIFENESKKAMFKKYSDSLKEGDLRRSYEIQFKSIHGEIKTGMVFSTTMKDRNGNKTGDLILVHNITENKKEESLKAAVYSISSAVNTMTNLKDLSEYIRDALGKVIDTSNFYIALFDKDKDLITLPYQKDEKDKIICFPAAKTMTGYVIKNDISLLATEDVQEKMHEQRYIDLVGAPSKVWLGVPLKIQNRVFGAVVVQSYDNPDLYTENDQEILEFVSEQIAVALERKRYEMSLKEAKNIAEEAAKAKADFLASMSHEIRTPMNGVIGMTSLLMDTTLTTEQKEYVDTIRVSGDSLLTIINDILDFSKIESGKMEIEKHPLSVVTTIEETYDLVAKKASEKNLDLVYLIQPDVPAMIVGDVTRLRQILVNLVNNAVKFTPDGDILITVKRNNLDDKLIELEFAVKDTGIGIPEKRLNKLFKAFSQVDSSTTRKYGGTGLGLAICKNLVKMMNGRIWVDSEEGVGSTFHFTIRTEIASVKRKKYMPDFTKDLKDIRVLVVDDNQTNRKILTLQFKNKGMHPYAVASAKEAIELINEGERFDIGVLDMHMPEMDGFELGKRIRERFSTNVLPLIMLSSIGKPYDMNSDDGIFNAYLPKPVKQRLLFEMILQLLGKSDDKRENTIKEDQKKMLDPQTAKMIPIKILLAEDNVINQKIAKRILEKMGYNIDIAANGLEVLSACDRQKYDLIFMDVQMPEMDGLEATRQLNKLYNEKNRPKIVAMTANAMEGDRERCLQAGMDDYISKPIVIAEIRNVLEKWGKKTRIANDGKLDRRSSDDIMDWKMIDSIKNLDIGDDIGNLLYELISQMFSDLPDNISSIKAAVNNKDHIELRATAHKLKGSSANLGAKGIAKVAYRFEVKGKEANFEDTEELFERMDKVVIDTREEYIKYFKEIDKDITLA